MAASAGDELLFERHGRVAVITLNRPQKLNALTSSMLDGLTALARQAAQDDSIGCVVVQAAGAGFCAGADLQDLAARNAQPEYQALSTEQRVARVAQRCTASLLLYEMAKPTIAVVNGVAAGGGMGLALSCDIRIGAPSARFVTSFARMALPGDFGLTFFLARRCPAAAEELMFLSEGVDAERALSLGLLNRVVDKDSLHAEALALAQRLADGPSAAFAAMKRNMRLADAGDLRATVAQEALATVNATRSDDHKEATRAFIEKRPPRFGQHNGG